MLVDSSVWIAYLRGDDLVEVAMLTEALEHRESVWLTATILQEVLQSADSPERFAHWDRVFGELPSINSPDAPEAARSAAHLHARCRWAGVTPRSANDCLIATHAIFAGMPLLRRDRDFEVIAGVEPKLMLVPAKQQYSTAMENSVMLATARRHRASLWTQDADFEGLPGARYYAKR